MLKYLAKAIKEDFSEEDYEGRPGVSIEGQIRSVDTEHSFDSGGVITRIEVGYSDQVFPFLEINIETEGGVFGIKFFHEVAVWLIKELSKFNQKIETEAIQP